MKKFVTLAVILTAAAYIVWTQTGQDAGGKLAKNGGTLAEVKIPVLQGDAIEGKQIYNASCAACHGVNANGLEGAGPPLVHRIYAPASHSDIAFLLAVRNGVRAHHWGFGSMFPQEGLTDDDVSKIVEYVRALQRENGID